MIKTFFNPSIRSFCFSMVKISFSGIDVILRHYKGFGLSNRDNGTRIFMPQ